MFSAANSTIIPAETSSAGIEQQPFLFTELSFSFPDSDNSPACDIRINFHTTPANKKNVVQPYGKSNHPCS